MRTLARNIEFVASVLAALAIMALVAFAADASEQLLVTLLVLGLFTALMECVLRSRSTPPP